MLFTCICLCVSVRVYSTVQFGLRAAVPTIDFARFSACMQNPGERNWLAQWRSDRASHNYF